MFILFLVQFGLPSGHLLGNSCSQGRTYILFVILVIYRFGFDGWLWVLIASVLGLCILFTFVIRFGAVFNLFTLLHRNSTVARRVTNVTSEHYGDP